MVETCCPMTDNPACRATNVLIDGFTIFNGDDAVAIQAGAKNVTVRNGLASGPGCHGMSIGSLGQNQGLFASVSKWVLGDSSASS